MRILDGAMGLNPQVLTGQTVIGVDQRFESWDCSFLSGERTSVGVIPKLVAYAKVKDWETAFDLIKKYKVRCGVGDCRPEAGAMARLQAACSKANVDFWRAQYATSQHGNVEMVANAKEKLLTLERTLTLHNVLHACATTMGIALPQNYEQIHDGAFRDEMCASTKVPVLWNGMHYERWVEVRDDHAFHSLNYALIAFKLGRLDRGGGDTLYASRGLVSSSLADDGPRDPEYDMPLWNDSGGQVCFEA